MGGRGEIGGDMIIMNAKLVWTWKEEAAAYFIVLY
jgi:hypothetical protein